DSRRVKVVARAITATITSVPTPATEIPVSPRWWARYPRPDMVTVIITLAQMSQSTTRHTVGTTTVTRKAERMERRPASGPIWLAVLDTPTYSLLDRSCTGS